MRWDISNVPFVACRTLHTAFVLCGKCSLLLSYFFSLAFYFLYEFEVVPALRKENRTYKNPVIAACSFELSAKAEYFSFFLFMKFLSVHIMIFFFIYSSLKFCFVKEMLKIEMEVPDSSSSTSKSFC